MRKCKNCGAPITGDRCEYCGCKSVNENEGHITIPFNGENIDCYIDHVGIEEIVGESGRNLDGEILRPKTKRLYTFTLVSW